MKKLILCSIVFVLLAFPALADEGMWIPMLLKKYNIEDMQQAGFKLTAEDIYSINQASLKDAVVGLGYADRPFFHFCTGEIVSDQGLVLTNHHCSFGMIQSHSTLEHNYLRDGFWANSLQEELMNPGITASILVRMEDVTAEIEAAVRGIEDEEVRAKKIQEVSQKLEADAVMGTDLKANIKPYFNGNQYFMCVFKIYRDVRLVGAPNSAIGKFGGDTDNWVWPRHTGDFSVLRIYANEENEPADPSPDNVPYQPNKFFRISARGVQEGDFTMVFGYPGTTKEYLTSYAIEQVAEVENPHKIAIRTAKLNIINAAMESDELLRIKYAAKAASVANAWKKWQGEIKGLEHFQVVEAKRAIEERFNEWVKTNGKTEYADILARYAQLYEAREDYVLAAAYASEAGLGGAEIVGLISTLDKAFKRFEDIDDVDTFKLELVERVRAFYKDYDVATDCRILSEMLRLYNEGGLSERWIPAEVRLPGKYAKSEDYVGYAEELFRKSPFTSQERLEAFINNLSAKAIEKAQRDNLWGLMRGIALFVKDSIVVRLNEIEREITRLNRVWMAGLMEMQPDKVFYPDANSTLRVAYGEVAGYAPCDGVYYEPYTTISGIIEKDNPAIYDYDVPQRLKDLYRTKDFGPYAQDGDVPVCFVATNHTTGGNSGSPVLDGEGNLIGINFDRAWEGVMSDMYYAPDICRNIAVDIRYVLFIIDKYAGAQRLIDEMEILF